MHGVASALADGGNNLEYNHGVMFYFAFWSFLSFLFMIGSVRTHMVNVVSRSYPTLFAVSTQVV